MAKSYSSVWRLVSCFSRFPLFLGMALLGFSTSLCLCLSLSLSYTLILHSHFPPLFLLLFLSDMTRIVGWRGTRRLHAT